MSAYADTSFLASLYVPDANSASAIASMKRLSLPVLLTPLTQVELMNAFSLRILRKELTSSKVDATRALVRADIDSGVLWIAPFGSTIFERARQMTAKQTPRLGTRTLDLLHVASALVLRADTFCTFDQRQASLASAEGLRLQP